LFDACTQEVGRRTGDRGESKDLEASMTALFIVGLLLFLALLTVADLLPVLAEPPALPDP
jgi:hypothetical protein